MIYLILSALNIRILWLNLNHILILILTQLIMNSLCHIYSFKKTDPSQKWKIIAVNYDTKETKWLQKVHLKFGPFDIGPIENWTLWKLDLLKIGPFKNRTFWRLDLLKIGPFVATPKETTLTKKPIELLKAKFYKLFAVTSMYRNLLYSYLWFRIFNFCRK